MNSNRVLTGIFSSWASFLVTAVTALVMAPFLVSRLGDAGYGLWSMYMAITGYFTLLDFGVSPAIVRFTSRFQALGAAEAERRILASGLLFFSVASGIVLIVTGVGTLLYGQLFPPPGVPLEVARTAFLLVGLDFSITLPFAIFNGVLLGRQRYLEVNAIQIVVRLVRFVLVLVLVREGAESLVTLAGIFFAIGLVRDLGLYHFSRPLRPVGLRLGECRREALRELLGYSGPAFLISISLRLISYTDSLVIGYVVGVEAITVFALAASLVDYVQEIGWGMGQVLVPVVSAHEARGELVPIQERFLAFTRYSVWLVLPILAVAYVLGPSFFTRWIGPDYLASADLLNILLLAMSLYVVQMPGQAVLKGMSAHRMLALFMGVEAALNLVLSVILGRELGVLGVALGTLLPRALLCGLVQPLHTLRVLRLRVSTYLRDGLLPGLPLLGGMAALVLGWHLWDPGLLGWLAMILTGLVFGGVALVSVTVFGLRDQERTWVKERLEQTRQQVQERLRRS